jgi:hypothetical protein
VVTVMMSFAAPAMAQGIDPNAIYTDYGSLSPVIDFSLFDIVPSITPSSHDCYIWQLEC